VAREEGDLNDIRAILGNDKGPGPSGREAEEAVLKTCFPSHQAIKDRDLYFTHYSPYAKTRGGKE
jgi:hypothetical protein